MDNFPGNSHSDKGHPVAKKVSVPKPEAKKIEKIVEGDVVRRKKPLGRRFLDTFNGGDAKNAIAYVFKEVLIPGAKDMISDAISQGTDQLLWGEVRGGNRRQTNPLTRALGQVAYHRMSNTPGPLGGRTDPRAPQRRMTRDSHSIDEIVLGTRTEADAVLEQLFELISTYEVATIADLYGMLGETGSFIDEKWGWSDLRGSRVVRTKGGYLLSIPRPEPID